MMDLVLWRHAEAEDLDDVDESGGRDLSRRLTNKGERQAARMGAWLDRQLPHGTRIFCSPAVRTEQTAIALGRKYRLCEELLPDASAQALLEVVQWPTARHITLVVGHQPTLGSVIAELAGLQAPVCSVKKGAVWWLRYREREGVGRTTVYSVQSPDLL